MGGADRGGTQLRRRRQVVDRPQGARGDSRRCGAITVSWKGGGAMVTDGPFLEAKETVGGFGILDADTREEGVRSRNSRRNAVGGCGVQKLRSAADLAEQSSLG